MKIIYKREIFTMEDKNNFGNYLKYLREDYGYTLNELASTIGYSGAYLDRLH